MPGALRLYTPEEGRAVVEQVRPWQREFSTRYGRTLVYLADEFYLMADAPIPSARHYDGFPQYENGIGIVRALLDDWQRTRRRLGASIRALHPEGWPGERHGGERGRRAVVVCGKLPERLIRTIVAEMHELGFDVTLVAVANGFFGASVTVSGLLTGTDVTSALAGSACDLVFLPRNMLDTAGARTLDGWTPADLKQRLAAEVVFASTFSAVVEVIRDL